MTRQERAQRVAEKLGLKIEGFTPGPWKAGYWSGVCRIPEHNGNHPGPPECKYEPEFNEMRSDEFGSGFVGIGAEQPGVDVVSTSYGSLKILPADAHLIAAAPTLWNHLLDLEEEVAIQDVKITVAHRNISALMERAEKAEELMKRVSRDYHQNRNMKWIVLDIDNLLTAPDFRPEISTESEKGGAS